jgi:GNAT superfamily N-acetyltransferase
MSEINFVEKIGDTNYIEVDSVTYGIQDVSNRFKKAFEEAKILTKENKLKEFRKIIPSYEVFKNLIKEKNGYILIEEMFDVDIADIIEQNTDNCLYLERIAIEPKYWHAGIGKIIYSYIESMAKEYGYKCVTVGAVGTWQIINFYIRQGFIPTQELDAKYIVPLLTQLNDHNLAITDEDGERYIMPMEKSII